MDSDGIRIRPGFSDNSDNDFRRPGAWPDAHEDSREGTGHDRSQAGGGRTASQSGSQQQQQHQRQRHWKPRKCRICFDVVQPTFVPPVENIPGIFQPKPQVVYESEDGGRLLCPCKCKGSNKYVHEGCLQQWRLQDPTSKRNYWSCPTCKFNYRLSRLGWSRFLGMKASQIVLTLAIFVISIFVLGFIADPIIDLYYNPWNYLSFGFLGGGSYHNDPYYSTRNSHIVDERPTWTEHFAKGFAGLGLLSMVKAVLASPFYFFRLGGGGGGGGGRRGGRERMNEINWIVVLIGVATFIYATWKFVAAWSARFLQRIGERVMDVQADDDDDDDDDDNFDE